MRYHKVLPLLHFFVLRLCSKLPVWIGQWDTSVLFWTATDDVVYCLPIAQVDLHVNFQDQFKVLLLTSTTILCLRLAYLKDHLIPYEPLWGPSVLSGWTSGLYRFSYLIPFWNLRLGLFGNKTLGHWLINFSHQTTLFHLKP